MRGKDYNLILQNSAYDPLKEPPPDQIVMRIQGQNIGSLGNFITITGMPKNGKGKYLSGILAGALSRTEIFGISTRLPEHKKKIALFDTEQSDWDFYKSMEMIKRLTGQENFPDHFHAFCMREYDPIDILYTIDTYLKREPDCGLLCIDGILDLLNSFNDEGESKKLVNILKKWTKINGLLAPIVLHRGKTTGTTLGQFGSMADRASQSTLIVEKNKERNSFILKPDFLRSAEQDFTPIEIYYDKSNASWQETLFVPDQDEKIKRMKLQPHELDKTIHLANVNRIFNASEILQYDSLVQSIAEIYAAGREWARKCVPELMKHQLVFKMEYGYTNNHKAKLFIQH